MSSSSYEYAAVARDTTILAQFANVSGNFDVLVTEILQKINIRENQFVCERNGHKIFIQKYTDLDNSDNSNGFNLYFILVCTINSQTNDAYSVLDKIQRSFLLRYSRSWQNCASYGLNKEFSGELNNILSAQQMKIQQIKDNLSTTQEQMTNNLQKALLRNTALEDLNQSASEISQSSREFARSSTRVNRRQFYNRLFIALLIIFILFAISLIIYFIFKD